MLMANGDSGTSLSVRPLTAHYGGIRLDEVGMEYMGVGAAEKWSDKPY
jgi:hypothetical protein